MVGKTDTSIPLTPDNWDERIQEFYNYWVSIHPSEHQLPSRAHFAPEQIPALLPRTWMFNVYHNPLRFKFRLLGTSIAPVVGKEASGEWLDEAFPDLVNTGVYDDYSYVAKNNKPLYRNGQPQYFMPDYKNIERLILPLVDEKGACEILLGISIYT